MSKAHSRAIDHATHIARQQGDEATYADAPRGELQPSEETAAWIAEKNKTQEDLPAPRVELDDEGNSIAWKEE
jgi:hypothetical protein